MLPLLECLRDRQSRGIKEVTNLLARKFNLTSDELAESLPSGPQGLFYNRVAWSKFHLKAAGLLDSPTRGMVRITDLGYATLERSPKSIDVSFLKKFPAYVSFIGKGQQESVDASTSDELPEEERRTPLELIESSFRTLSKATANDLLSRLRSASPAFFEETVVKLLLAMGYGKVPDDGMVTGGSGDGGIDGVIKLDKLGLEVVCIQAKRWQGSVGRPEIQSFVGSMDLHRARKGVMLTTSTFTKEAQTFVERIEGKKVVLIDGEHLADLMIEHNLGVVVKNVYELKEVSNDFFEEDTY